jgi:ketol-acid reductoisomerase
MKEDIYYQLHLERDLRGKKVAIIGYHNQDAMDFARFLRDNNIDVIVGLRIEDDRWQNVKQDGFEVFTIWEAVQLSDVAQVW